MSESDSKSATTSSTSQDTTPDLHQAILLLVDRLDRILMFFEPHPTDPRNNRFKY